MDRQKRYEDLMRQVFGNVDRWGDPAGIADTSVYRKDNINTIKSGLGYASEILSRKASNEDAIVKKVKNEIQRIHTAKNLEDFDSIVENLQKIADALKL